MLTQEQIKNLKKGDNLLVEAYFVEKDGYNLKCSLILPWFYESRAFSVSSDLLHLPSEHGTFSSRRSSAGAETEVPTPKHDLIRLFKKGDKVRVVKCKGRNYTGQTTGEIGIVSRDESPGTASVEVEFADEDMWDIDPAYLELVTPRGRAGAVLCGTARRNVRRLVLYSPKTRRVCRIHILFRQMPFAR